MLKSTAEDGAFVPKGKLDGKKLMQLPQNECTAAILNDLFDLELSGYDIDFCIGRSPVRLVNIGQRMAVAECWRNGEGELEAHIRRLAEKLGAARCIGWVRVAIQAAILGGVMAQLKMETLDFAVQAGDLSLTAGLLYLRQWGFPVGNILTVCNENSGLWDLIYHGFFRTDGVAKTTAAPDGDCVIPEELERLVEYCGGADETASFLECCSVGKIYRPQANTQKQLMNELSSAVISDRRMALAVSGQYRADGYVFSPEAALAQAGAQDYRASSGDYRPTLILSTHSPEHSAEMLCRLLRISPQELKRNVN